MVYKDGLYQKLLREREREIEGETFIDGSPYIRQQTKKLPHGPCGYIREPQNTEQHHKYIRDLRRLRRLMKAREQGYAGDNGSGYMYVFLKKRYPEAYEAFRRELDYSP